MFNGLGGHFVHKEVPMDEIWAKLYAAAKAVQQERQISDYVLAGGVAAAVLSTSGKI